MTLSQLFAYLEGADALAPKNRKPSIKKLNPVEAKKFLKAWRKNK